MVVMVVVSNSSCKNGGYSYDLFPIPYDFFAITNDLLVIIQLLTNEALDMM